MDIVNTMYAHKYDTRSIFTRFVKTAYNVIMCT